MATKKELKQIMQRAWFIAKKAAKRFNDSSSLFFPAALDKSWNEHQLRVLKNKNKMMKRKISILNAKYEQYRRINLEGGEGFNPIGSKIEKMQDHFYNLLLEIKNKEWTKDKTEERRANWNQWIQGTYAKLPREKQVFSIINQQQKKQGWEIVDLKKYLVNWNLV